MLSRSVIYVCAIACLFGFSLGMPAAHCSEQTTTLQSTHGNLRLRIKPIKVKPPLKFHFGKHAFVPPPPSSGYVNVKQYGAVGDGVTDDSNAILSAISAAKARSTGVFFPAGNYVTSVYLTSSVPLLGIGGGSILSTAAGQLVLQGNGVGLTNMVIVGQQGVTIANSNNFNVSQVTIQNCRNGITVQSSNNGVISSVAIINASNVGLTIQDSNYVQLLNSNVSASGPYALQTIDQSQSNPLSGCTVAYNQIQGNVAMDVVSSCVFDYNTLTNGSLVFGSQTNSQGYVPMSGLEIIGNSLNGAGIYNQSFGIRIANYYDPNGEYPAPYYISTADTIQIANNHVSNANVGIAAGGINNCSITSNTVSNTGNAMSIGGYCNCIISGNNITGTSCTAVLLGPNNGTIQFSNNQISNSCTTTGGISVILCSTQYYAPTGNVAIYNNNYGGPLNYLQYLIVDELPGSQSNPNIYGNTDPFMLPNLLAP
jgi:hypothetical protein